MEEQEIFDLIKTFDVKTCLKYVNILFIDNKEKTAKVINNHAIDLYQDFPEFFKNLICYPLEEGIITIDNLIDFILLLDNMTIQLRLFSILMQSNIYNVEDAIDTYYLLSKKLLLQNSDLKTKVSIDEVKILGYKQKYEQLQLEVALKPSCEVCKNDGGNLFKDARESYSHLIEKLDNK